MEKWEKEAIKACAEKICYLHGTLVPNDIIPDLKELLSSEKQRVVEAVMKLFVVYLGDNDEITLMTEGRNQGLKDVLSALQGERGE